MTFEMFLALVTAVLLLGIVAALVSNAYRVGHANGVTAERLRRSELEKRVAERIDQERLSWTGENLDLIARVDYPWQEEIP